FSEPDALYRLVWGTCHAMCTFSAPPRLQASGVVLVMLLSFRRTGAISDQRQVFAARQTGLLRPGGTPGDGDASPARNAGKNSRAGPARRPAARVMAHAGCARRLCR